MPDAPRSCAQRRNAGFSLVEVILSIGVVSCALVSILGGLSVGLTTLNEARKDVMHAQIIAQASSSILQTPFDQIATKDPQYLNRAGLLKKNSEAAQYSVEVQVTRGATNTYPGAPATIDTSVKCVQITVSTLEPATQRVVSSSRSVFVVPRS